MLLHKGSIVVEVCLVLIATHGASSADYDYSEDDDKRSGYSHPDYSKYYGEKASASGSVANKKDPNSFDASFVYPEEYENFYFSPSGYKNEPNPKGSSNKKTFAPQPSEAVDRYDEIKKSIEEAATYVKPLKKDYFEESQEKQQQAEESEIRPGPHYVSHQLPVPERFKANSDDDDDDEEDRSQSKDDVETIPPPLKGKHKGSKSAPSEYDSYDYGSFERLRKDDEQRQPSKTEPVTFFGGKNVDYDTGKSSSTVSQYPAANNYLASLKLPSTTVPSYQKYNQQPVTVDYKTLQSKYLETLADSPSPVKNAESSNLNNQQKDDGLVAPSENVPENLKKKGCRRIEGPENAEDMNCFVCEDSGNKAKYTQCSYGSAEPTNAGSSIAYATPVKAPAPIRRKRSPYDSKYDPYLEISQRSRKYFEDFEKEQQAAESERQKDFHYKPYDEESYSESQSSELLKEPGACQKVERDGSICTVCKNPKTGGNFEQCSYASAPKEHKYAYVAEKKYDSDDEPEETKVEVKHSSDDPQSGASSSPVSQSAEAPTEQFSSATKSKIIKDPIPELSVAGSSVEETSAESTEGDQSRAQSESDEESDSSDEQKEEKDPYAPYYFSYADLKKDKKLVDDDPYDVPEHFAASVNQKKTANEEDELGFDEYHYKLFPELNKEAESRNEEQRTDATQQKPNDVEEVLAEFAKKDRSKCQKAEKNGMTCFLCVDQNKVQHEECMYIAESKPRPTHIAYHEVQRLKDPKDDLQPLVTEHSEPEESKKVETLTAQPSELVSETTKKKRFFKKVISAPLALDNIELSAAASDVYKTVVPYEKTSKGYVKETVKDSRASGSAPDSEQVEEEDKKKSVEEPETPKEIDVGDEEGAFSHETKPVYSKLFGTTLPKYMVEKTEFEKDFDAASGFD